MYIFNNYMDYNIYSRNGKSRVYPRFCILCICMCRHGLCFHMVYENLNCIRKNETLVNLQ